MKRIVLAVVIGLVGLVGVSACSSGSAPADGGTDLTGTYRNSDEGAITLSDGGEASLDQGTVTALTWEQSGDTITLVVVEEPDKSITGDVEGDTLVFDEGFSGDEPVVFTRE